MVIRLSAALVLALVTSVAIAWAAAAYHSDLGGTWDSMTYSPSAGGWARLLPGATHLQVTGSDWTVDRAATARPIPQATVLGPAVAVARRMALDQDETTPALQYIAAAGWPWRCLWFRAQSSDDFSTPTLAPDDPAIDFTHLGTPTRMTLRALPLRPLWIGLAGNMLVFSAFWFLVLSIPAMLRGRRRRHGRCAGCGYIVKGISSSRCPECGRALSESGRVQNSRR
jgi:hypothetical protein